jgi:hypothetical protein
MLSKKGLFSFEMAPTTRHPIIQVEMTTVNSKRLTRPL